MDWKNVNKFNVWWFDSIGMIYKVNKWWMGRRNDEWIVIEWTMNGLD